MYSTEYSLFRGQGCLTRTTMFLRINPAMGPAIRRSSRLPTFRNMADQLAASDWKLTGPDFPMDNLVFAVGRRFALFLPLAAGAAALNGLNEAQVDVLITQNEGRASELSTYP